MFGSIDYHTHICIINIHLNFSSPLPLQEDQILVWQLIAAKSLAAAAVVQVQHTVCVRARSIGAPSSSTAVIYISAITSNARNK